MTNARRDASKRTNAHEPVSEGEPLAPQTVDIVVNESVIVETKAAERLRADAPSQLFNYLCSKNISLVGDVSARGIIQLPFVPSLK